MAAETQARPHWPRAAASAAIFRGDSILLVERGKGAPRGLWSLPGGHVEPGETVLAAAERELMEETSMAAEIAGLLDVRDVLIRDDAGDLVAHYVLVIYFGRARDGEPVAGSDSPSARFVPVGELDRYRLTDGVRETIALAQRRLRAAPAEPSTAG